MDILVLRKDGIIDILLLDNNYVCPMVFIAAGTDNGKLYIINNVPIKYIDIEVDLIEMFVQDNECRQELVSPI